MTRGPRRLLDDPDFKWETGCDLADERVLVGSYDLERGRRRLLATIATPGALSASGSAHAAKIGDGMPAIRTGSRWASAVKPFAGVAAGVGAVVGAFWLGVQIGAPDGARGPAPVAPIVAPAAPDAPAAPMIEPSEAAETAPAELPSAPADVPPRAEFDPSGRPAAVLEFAAPVHAAPVLAPTPVIAPAPVDARGRVAARATPAEPLAVGDADPVVATPTIGVDEPAVEATSDGVADASPVEVRLAPVSALRAQSELLSRAAEALGEGDPANLLLARDLYQTLAEWPDGSVVIEAKIGLLQALRAIGDADAVEALAADVQDLPEFSARRDEILRLRAESLVRSNRCAEALLVSEELPGRESAEIRRSCRRRE